MKKDNFEPSGIISISGDSGSGKTLASLFVNYKHAPDLNRVAYFHDDNKEPPFPIEAFGKFVDMSVNVKLFEYGSCVNQELEKLDPKKIKGVIFDTWTKYGEFLRHYVVSHRNTYREKEAFIMSHNPVVMGAQAWRDAHNYEGRMAGQIAKKFGFLVATSHVKEDMKGSTKTDKLVEDLGKIWEQSSNARLWLINTGAGVPAVLVKKRFDKSWVENGKPQTINFLPSRLTPEADDKSIWDIVNRYWKSPVGERKLSEYEVPQNQEEMAIVRDTWTERQYEVWKINLLHGNDRGDLPQSGIIKLRVQELNGKEFSDIQETIKNEFLGKELSFAEIGDMLR